jgi:hypothetical protein
MNGILKIIPILLYAIVGIISMVMAVKSLFSAKFLPFHEKAAKKPWDEIDNSLKLVILTLLRITGMGFLIISILLLACPLINYFIPNNFYKFSIPIISLIYCSGLFVINYILYKRTKANTPWKGSLYAMLAIIAGIIISSLN